MNNKDCCYEEMTQTVGGQSQPSEYHSEPYQNSYELTRKHNVGLNQFGIEKSK